MHEKIKSTIAWLPHYSFRNLKLHFTAPSKKPKHLYFCICDHFEPYWGNATKKKAQKRLTTWLEKWPALSEKFNDSYGQKLKYSFFYPEEEYQKDDLNALAELCHSGYGEVEIHLHHDNDTPENLKNTLIDYKNKLHEVHGLLSKDIRTGEIVYGFIHGNWALNNSRPDRRMCGINNETVVLLETGCYADFTFPSAPSITQTRKVNSIYYAADDKGGIPKSHDWGVDACVGKRQAGLLMIQGPLGLSWKHPKWGIFPRIENGGLMATTAISMHRVKRWIAQKIHISGAEEHIFIKIYAHGTQEKNLKMFFEDRGGDKLFSFLADYSERTGIKLHFVSAREMVNIVHALEEGVTDNTYQLNYYYRVTD